MLARVLLGGAFMAGLGSIWAKDMQWVAVICALLAMHATTAAACQRRIMDMQAQIDMMRMHRGEEPE